MDELLEMMANYRKMMLRLAEMDYPFGGNIQDLEREWKNKSNAIVKYLKQVDPAFADGLRKIINAKGYGESAVKRSFRDMDETAIQQLRQEVATES